MRARVVLMALSLAGCQQQAIRPPDLGPVSVSCSGECKASCLPDPIPGKFDAEGKPLLAWPRWECENPDDPACWDEQPTDLAKPMQEIAERCDAARASCLRCMKGMEQVGIVCGITKGCGQ